MALSSITRSGNASGASQTVRVMARAQKNRPPQPMEQPVRLSLADEVGALQPRKAEWNALVERCATNTVFQTFEWHTGWWKAFGDRVRPLVLVAEAAGELVGIAPLMISDRKVLGRRRRVVEFIGARSSDYCDFIVDRTRPQVLPLMVKWLAERADQWDLLHLSDIPDTSTTLPLLPRLLQPYGYRPDVRVLYQAPTRRFGDPVDDRRVVNKKSLKRHYNYFRRHGRLECRHCATAEEIMGYLDLFFQQHIERRALTDAPSLFLDERQQVFYRELVRALSPTGWLLFSVVLFNQRPIAFHFGFEYGDRIIWYKPAFDVEYFNHSPGEVLIKYLLEYALERGVAEFDLTIGEEAFKYRFANHTRRNYAVRVFRHPVASHVSRLALDAKALVKRYPPLARLGRFILRSAAR